MTHPVEHDAIGQSVTITGGLLAGRTGKIDALPDDARSTLVLIELDPHGSKVWIEVDHLN